MSTGAIIVNLAIFFLYIAVFYVVLIWLKVSDKKFVRSITLAAILKFAELAGSFLTGLLLAGFENVGVFGYVLNTALIVLIFYLVVRSLLKLKTWQYVVIPIGVSIVGNVAFAFIAMFYFKAMA